MAKHNESGLFGEDLAVKYLVGNGYVIRDRQWRYERLELDIVAENEDFVVFVEVKTRSSEEYGNPLEAVNETKLIRFTEAAEAYIQAFEIDKDVRFDLIGIVLSDPPELVHHEDAISPELE